MGGTAIAKVTPPLDPPPLEPAAKPGWYFTPFEGRKPPEKVPESRRRELVFQGLATAAVVLGVWYIQWRIFASVNTHALWIAIPLLMAETLAFIGSVLFFLSIWRNRDIPMQAPPATVNDILSEPLEIDRPLIVDVFFATYTEDPELVRLSLLDAKRMTYPSPIDVRLHVLDDGRRAAMRQVCDEEKVNYLSRSTNIGYKAGNVRNGMENTQGDLIVICDADTRPFPDLLVETLGYFRDHQVAWVQTPQWFFDLDPGTPLPEWLGRRARLGVVGRAIGRAVQAVIGPVAIGADPFGNDPQLFYDVIQRRRNWCNASFCCGAGSIHRREAVMEAALKSYGDQVAGAVDRYVSKVPDPAIAADLRGALTDEAARCIEVMPYKFHVSEDFYTSLALHSDAERKWKSVYHPKVLSQMLSPQDLLAWTIQRFKYAGGTLDIFFNDNPLKRPGLSPWQKLMYLATMYAYFSPVWTLIFLLAPLAYLFTGASPIVAYGLDFYAHIVPFLIINKLAFIVGTWGVPSWRGEQYYLSSFWINLRALMDAVRGKTFKFVVTPKEKQAGNFLLLVWPHVALIALTTIGLVVMGLQVFVLGTHDRGAYIANLFWAFNNLLALGIIVKAAVHHRRQGAAS